MSGHDCVGGNTPKLSFFLNKEFGMTKLTSIAKKFVSDENAAEVTELGIVLALVVAASVATIALIGPKIQAAYTLTNTNLP